jgi:hypothetical protein
VACRIRAHVGVSSSAGWPPSRTGCWRRFGDHEIRTMAVDNRPRLLGAASDPRPGADTAQAPSESPQTCSDGG